MSLHKFEKNPPHALLLVGDAKADALKFAVAVSAIEKLPHPDVHEYFPIGKSGLHAISSIKELIQEVGLSPFTALRKCFIIHEAERMLPSSSNALLKVIEEPPPKTIFLLLTSSLEKILPTIRSRAQILYFPKKEKTSSPLEETFITLFTDFSSKKLETFCKSLDDLKKEKEKELLKALPSDLTPHQKEAYEKEIEGEVTLIHTQEFFHLLELLFEHHLKKNHPFPALDNLFQKSRLAFERHLPPKVILETLFTTLN